MTDAFDAVLVRASPHLGVGQDQFTDMAADLNARAHVGEHTTVSDGARPRWRIVRAWVEADVLMCEAEEGETP